MSSINNTSDINNLNNQLSFLMKDYETGQQLQKTKNEMNKNISELNENNEKLLARQYDTTMYTGYQQPTLQRQQQPQQSYQPQQLQQHSYQNQPQQQYTRQQPTQTYNNIQRSREINEQLNTDDLRVQMNNQMDNLRFDNNVNLKSGLVPVDMEHIYSGNLFQNGTPIPEDIRNNYPQQSAQIQQYRMSQGLHGSQGHGGRILLQQKSKTSYRNDFNSRMEKLSPFNQQMFTPFQRQPLQTTAEGGIVLRENPVSGQQAVDSRYSMKRSIREDMNSKMSNYGSLPSIKPLPDSLKKAQQDGGYIPNPNAEGQGDNRKVEKLRYQEMMPVMSNY